MIRKRKRLLEKMAQQYRNRVRECRLRAIVGKQEELAKMTGIPRSTINALENNRLFLSSQYALLIRDVLGCTLDDLYAARSGKSEEKETSAIM